MLGKGDRKKLKKDGHIFYGRIEQSQMVLMFSIRLLSLRTLKADIKSEEKERKEVTTKEK